MILVLERRSFSTRAERKAAGVREGELIKERQSKERAIKKGLENLDTARDEYDKGFDQLSGNLQAARQRGEYYADRNNRQDGNYGVYRKSGGKKGDYKIIKERRTQLSNKMKDINNLEDSLTNLGKERESLIGEIAKQKKLKGNILQRGSDYVADTWDSGNSGKAKVIAGGTLAAAGLAAGGYYGYKALKKRRDRRRREAEEMGE